MAATDQQDRKPRVLVADGDCLVAAGIRKLLEQDCEVVGIVEDGRTLLAEAEKLRPDICITESVLPLLNGLDVAHRLAKVNPGSRIIFVTSQANSSYIAEAFRAGVSAYVLKRSAPVELSQAIHAVMKGQYYLTPLITKDLLVAGTNGSNKQIGPRQHPALPPSTRSAAVDRGGTRDQGGRGHAQHCRQDRRVS